MPKKKHPLYNQYVSETGDISGAGFGDWLKKTASNVYGRVSGFITGVRDDYPPAVRDLLKKYGDNKIVSILVRRDPLQKAVELASNILTLGQFQKAKKESGYDNYYHLYLVATLDNGITLLIEKNEVINISIYKDTSNGESMNVIMNEPIQLNNFLNNAKNGMGVKRFFYYDPITDNCQVFLNSLMSYNGLLNINPNLENFIMQDFRTLIKNLSSTSRKIMSGTTNLARRFNILINGKGLNFHPLHATV